MEWRCRNQACGAVLGHVVNGVLHPRRGALVRSVEPNGVVTFACPCGRAKPWFPAVVDGLTVARFLFDLLDDIDTVSDMAKDDDAAYRRAVEAIQRRRFEAAATDGYRVAFTEPLAHAGRGATDGEG